MNEQKREREQGGDLPVRVHGTPESFQVLWSKAAWAMAYGAVAGVVLWGAWATLQITSKPSVAEVIQIVKTESPYNADKKNVLENMNRLERALERTQVRLVEGFDRNVEAINGLRVDVATLSSRLEGKKNVEN